MKPRLLFILNSYEPGAIPKILNLIFPYLDSYKVKLIFLEKNIDSTYIEKLPLAVEYLSLNKHRLNILGTLFSLRAQILMFNPDIIHSHLGRADLFSAICKLRTSKLITTIHTVRSLKIRRGLMSLTQIILSLLDYRFDYKIYVSELIKMTWGNNKNKVSKVIYNPVTIQKKSEKGPRQDKEFTILFVGRLFDFKNAFLIVKAIRIIVNMGQNVKLIIAGDGPQYNLIKKYISKFNIEEKVQLLGFINNIEEFYIQSDVIIFPSKWSSGLPMVILEASQFNTAVISANISGVNFFLNDGENCIFFESNSERNLVEKILFLKDNPEIRNQIAENLYRYVLGQFSQETCAKKYINVYESLLV